MSKDTQNCLNHHKRIRGVYLFCGVHRNLKKGINHWWNRKAMNSGSADMPGRQGPNFPTFMAMDMAPEAFMEGDYLNVGPVHRRAKPPP